MMTEINLLPRELKEERKKARFNFKVATICSLFFLVFVLLVVAVEAVNQVLVLNLNATKTQIQFQENEIEKLSDVDQKIKEINEILSLVADLEQGQILWRQILREVAASTPTALRITALTADPEKLPNFTISGDTPLQREIFKFKEKLESSDYLKNIAFSNSSQTSTEAGVIFNFTLQADFEKKR